MIIQQLSIFLENKSGRLNEVAKILSAAGVNMSAFSIADTSDFGILRVIVSDPEKAVAVLKEKFISASLTQVVCLKCPDQSGALSKALDILDGEGIVIEYMYAFSVGSSATVVIRPGSVDQCISALQRHELELVKASDMYKI